MRLFGSLTDYVQSIFKKNGFSITLRPNASTTYTAARTMDLPPGDASHVLLSATSVQDITAKTLLQVDNIQIDANTISSTNANGNIDLDANGTGVITVQDNLQLKSGKDLVFFDDDNSNTITLGVPSNVTSNRTPQIPDDTGDVVLTSATQTLTAKILQNDLVDNYLDFNEEASPATPSANTIRMYGKSDGKMYRKDDTGTEFELGAGGSGELNFIDNPSDATSWSETGSVFATPATTTTAGDLPLAGVVDSAIQFVATGNGSEATTYNSYTFTTSAATATKLKAEFYMRPGTGFVASEWTISIYAGSTRQTLSTDSSAVSVLPALTGKYTTTFDAAASTVYTIRFARTSGSGSATLNVANVIVGPGTQPQGAAVSEWVSFTPTGAWTSNTTYAGRYRRVGDSMQIIAQASTSAAPTAVTFSINLPTGFTLDTTKLPASTSETQSLGSAMISFNTGTTRNYPGVVYITPNGVANSVGVAFGDQGTVGNIGFVDATRPATFDAGDFVYINCIVPISEWSGSGTLNVVQNDVEYAYNSDTTDANNTSAFAYGPTGTQFGSFTATRTKQVRFLTPIQDTDVISLEYFDTNQWQAVGNNNSNIQTQLNQNSILYGMCLDDIGSASSTDVNVTFGTYRLASGATYGAAGLAWSGVAATNNFRWRVKKTKSGQAVGFGPATSTLNGLVSREIAPSEGDLGTLTWGGAVAPSGTITKRYKWSQVGKVVTLEWRIEASSAGTANTFVSTPLPSTMPNPSNHSNQSNDEWVTVAGGAVLSGASSALNLGGAAGLYKDSGGAYLIYVYSGTATVAASFAAASLSYIVD